MKLTVDPARADPLFVYYSFASRPMQNYIRNNAIQTGVPHINLGILRSLSLTLPPLAEQQAIAEVLGALDDKIELNRRMNATLEELARTIFRSWFVDFDPVHSKAEGRDPFGMDADTAALFPDSFVPSELGEIPAGWYVSTIGEAFEIVGGSTPSTKRPEFWDPPIHTWTTPKDLSGKASPVLLRSERKISDAGLATISSGLLPRGTLLMSSRAPIGYLAINDVPTAINQGFIAMKQRWMLPTHYGLFWAQHNMDAIKSRANGSTFMEISKSSFRPMPILVPEPHVIHAFYGIFWPMWERLVLNLKESETLAELRDTLLPKLLSGEITVKAAERELVSAK